MRRLRQLAEEVVDNFAVLGMLNFVVTEGIVLINDLKNPVPVHGEHVLIFLEVFPELLAVIKPPLLYILPLLLPILPGIEFESEIGVLQLRQLDVEDSAQRVIFVCPLAVELVKNSEVESKIVDFLLGHPVG